MNTLYKDQRNLLAVVLYWQLNQVRYIPPISYFFSQADNNNAVNLSPPELNLINYDRSISTIIKQPIDKSQTAIL